LAVIVTRPVRFRLQPEMLEARTPVIPAGHAERMYIGVPLLPPVLERNAQLERPLDGRHELLLVYFEQPVEGHQCRYRRLADTDRPELVAFDQADVQDLAQRLREQRRRQPAGRAASGNHYFFHDGFARRLFLRAMRSRMLE